MYYIIFKKIYNYYLKFTYNIRFRFRLIWKLFNFYQLFKLQMKLRYSGNIMPFEDSMKKVAAITWSPSGKKLAVGAADRVVIY